MEKLNLNFLNEPDRRKLDPIEQVLYRFGDEISRYARGYFNYIVTTTLEYEMVREAALYIVVPEIDYNYRVLSLTYLDIANVKIEFFTLKTEQVETLEVSITLLEAEISRLLSTRLANSTFRHLIDLATLKKERDEE